MLGKNRLNVKKQFREALLYLRESLFSILLVCILFFASVFVGFVFYEKLSPYILPILAQILEESRDLNTLEMIFFILQNNLFVSFGVAVLGVVFGIVPLLATIGNGIVIGYVLARVYIFSGLASWLQLFPHGIFELPAVLFSLGLGLKLGLSFFQGKGDVKKLLIRRFYQTMNVFLMIIIPLLIIAAVIEGILIALLQ